jgi:hypothetical protein
MTQRRRQQNLAIARIVLWPVKITRSREKELILDLGWVVYHNRRLLLLVEVGSRVPAFVQRIAHRLEYFTDEASKEEATRKLWRSVNAGTV